MAEKKNISEITFPPDVTFYEDIRLFVHRPHGMIDESTVNKIISAIGDLEAARPEPFNRFLDALAVDEVELNFQYVIHISLYRRLTYAGRPEVKTAILATNAALVHYSRLHAMLTQGSSIHVRIFDDRNNAAEWLEVPVERLLPDSPAA